MFMSKAEYGLILKWEAKEAYVSDVRHNKDVQNLYLYVIVSLQLTCSRWIDENKTSEMISRARFVITVCAEW